MSQQRSSLIDAFPAELIQELVGWLDVDSIDDPRARAFSSVCSAFRKAIINTPQLYESIKVNLDEESTVGMSEWLRIKIERSKPSQNLRVYITGRKELTHGGPMLDATLGCCERWANLNLEYIHPITLNNLLHPVEGRLASLRQLWLSFFLDVPEDMRSTLSAIPPFFRNLPLLEEVSILPLPARNLSFLPLHQIVDCIVAGFNNVGEVKPPLSILLHPESRLERLFIQMHPEAVNSWDSGRPFHAPHLTRLQVVPDPYGDPNQEATDCTRLLENLTAPALRILRMWFDNISSTTILRLAESSRCALEYLEMGCSNPFSDTVRLLAISSSLTVLVLRVANLAILQEFPHIKDPTFLPNLRLWRLAVSRDRYEDGRTVLKHFLNPIGETGESTFLDQIGLARCELPVLETTTSPPETGLDVPPLVSFSMLNLEIDLLHPFIARAIAQVFCRLPLEECNFDMEFLRTLREFSAVLEERMLASRTEVGDSDSVEEFLSKLSEISGKAVQQMDNAQYLYVRDSCLSFRIDHSLVLFSTRASTCYSKTSSRLCPQTLLTLPSHVFCLSALLYTNKHSPCLHTAFLSWQRTYRGFDGGSMVVAN